MSACSRPSPCGWPLKVLEALQSACHWLVYTGLHSYICVQTLFSATQYKPSHTTHSKLGEQSGRCTFYSRFCSSVTWSYSNQSLHNTNVAEPGHFRDLIVICGLIIYISLSCHNAHDAAAQSNTFISATSTLDCIPEVNAKCQCFRIALPWGQWILFISFVVSVFYHLRNDGGMNTKPVWHNIYHFLDLQLCAGWGKTKDAIAIVTYS